MVFSKIESQIKTPLSTAEIVASGISKPELAAMVATGRMRRVRWGYYMTREAFDQATEESLVDAFFPDAVVCGDSALFHYGYINRTPSVWHLAFLRNVSRSRLKASPVVIRPYYHTWRLFEVGVVSEDFNGTVLRVYDRERTLCGCFARRASMDAETFAEAVTAYATDGHKNLANLSEYARVFGVSKAVESMMEVVLNA